MLKAASKNSVSYETIWNAKTQGTRLYQSTKRSNKNLQIQVHTWCMLENVLPSLPIWTNFQTPSIESFRWIFNEQFYIYVRISAKYLPQLYLE